MHVLLAEDDLSTSTLISHVLKRAGYSVECVTGGHEAIQALSRRAPDVIVTDWNMPGMDGLALVQSLRKKGSPPPIVMLTANSALDQRTRALLAGADEFLAKPAKPQEIVDAVGRCLGRATQQLPHVEVVKAPPPSRVHERAPFPALLIASSTGGPDALRAVIPDLPKSLGGAVFVAQHAPAFIMDALVASLQRVTDRKVELAVDGMKVEEGGFYLAPGDFHMQVLPKVFALDVNQDPPENYVRPAADPLFRSAAAAFGSKVVAVVLTGLGRDGAQGCAEVKMAGGVVIAQDPKTAVAPPMPKSVVEAGLADEVVPLAEVGRTAAAAMTRMVAARR